MRPASRLSVALATLAIIFTGVPAKAAPTGLDVSPRVGIRSTVPGRIVEEILTVVNLSSDDYSVAATIDDLAVDSEGRFFSGPAGSGLPSAAAWGVVQPASFLLPRGHTQTVRIAFKPPARTQPQGYYASINFVGSPSQGPAVRSMHPLLLQVDGDGLLRSGEITAISVPWVAVGSTARVTLHLKNAGNVYALAQGRVTVRDALSRVTAVRTISGIPVLPGTTRILEVEIPTPLIPGGIRVTAELGFGPGVPNDSATTTLLAFAWWHIAVLGLLILILLRLAFGIFQRRMRRRAMRKKVQVEAASVEIPTALPEEIAADLQSSWEPAEEPSPPKKPAPAAVAPPEIVPPASAEPEPRHEPAPEPPAAEPEPEVWAPPVVVPIASARPAAVTPPAAEEEDEEVELWPEPRVIPRAKLEPEMAEEEEPEEDEVELPLLAPAPAPVEPDPVPVVAVVEPEPVPISVPAIEAKPSPPFVAEEFEPPGPVRAEKLSELVKAGIPAGPPAGPQAASRRVKVAVDLLASGSGKSTERLDVAIQILASAGEVDAAEVVHAAFEDAASSKRAAAMGSLALALARLDSPRAPEALLRAYADSPRAGSAMLRDTLKRCDPAVLKAQPGLLAALPEDRRAALKLG